MSKLHILILAGAMAAAAPFSATAAETVRTIDAKATFQTQRDAILKALDDGETYVEISNQDKIRVRELLSRIETFLGSRSRIDELPVDSKVQAYNAQEEINTLLTRAHGESRQVCERIQQVGSHRRTTTCMTVAERRRTREAAQEAIQRKNIRPLDQGM